MKEIKEDLNKMETHTMFVDCKDYIVSQFSPHENKGFNIILTKKTDTQKYVSI